MMRCRPGTVKNSVSVAVPGLQRTADGMLAKSTRASAALRCARDTRRSFDSRGPPATFCHRLHNAFSYCIQCAPDVHSPIASLIEGSLPEANQGGARQVA